MFRFKHSEFNAIKNILINITDSMEQNRPFKADCRSRSKFLSNLNTHTVFARDFQWNPS